MSSGDESHTPSPDRDTPATPRKRRRLESPEPARVRRYDLEGKYSDAYRVLFNDHVTSAAAPFAPDGHHSHTATQYGASTWSAAEHATLFAALARLGRDDVAGIARAVGSKSIPETHDLLLLLRDAASNKGDVGLTLRHVPAAIEVARACDDELGVMADALAWYQEQWEVVEEQKRYGDHWLITPALAADIESALSASSRAASTRPTTPADPGTPRSGPGIAGSCERCKRHKIRCDRQVPCTNCARVKKQVVCEYRPTRRQHKSVDLTPQSPRVGEDALNSALTNPAVTAPQILQDIPEASLLHAENMLVLSRDLFMNRSPDIASPWPHWSAYASDQVPQPSIIRTAFNDFHALALSVTKRLMQAAIAQATSRLRSQRRRTKKGVMPFIKTRDVLSAIDILGLKRNGRSRWTGVARRCNLRVFDEQRTTRFKIKQREISWDQAEQILGLYDAVSGSAADQVSCEDPDDTAFKRMAARHGTPLPMEHLSLSNADAEPSNSPDPTCAISDDEAEASDYAGQSSSESSSAEDHTPHTAVREKQTLEQFDQEASRQEEQALCARLQLTIEHKTTSPSVDEADDSPERLFNKVDDWRNWTDYHAVWEEFESPVPVSSFISTQPRTTLVVHHDLDSDASSTTSASPQRPRPAAVELQTRNPRTYAALQGDAYDARSEPDSEDADIPTQSIEDTSPAHNTQDTMDWER